MLTVQCTYPTFEYIVDANGVIFNIKVNDPEKTLSGCYIQCGSCVLFNLQYKNGVWFSPNFDETSNGFGIDCTRFVYTQLFVCLVRSLYAESIKVDIDISSKIGVPYTSTYFDDQYKKQNTLIYTDGNVSPRYI